MKIIERLQQRGLIEQMTPGLAEHLTNPAGVYLGIDPTADSLHLGNLVPIMALAWLRKAGHRVHFVVGGATGRIGDPSGRSIERPLLSEEELNHNVKSISHFLHSMPLFVDAPVLDNMDWLGKFTLIDFLRDVGKQFRVSVMLAKDSVRTRLESEEGISFTEFTYQALQGYDFYHLHKTKSISLQVGGSDQWGNITAGIELNRKMGEASIHGLAFPLLTRSDGKKFGKTAEGAVWLSAHRYSPYQLYQYLLSIPDADVGRMLRVFTFLEEAEIDALEPGAAQRRLGDEVVRFVHGEEALQGALQLSSGLAPGSETRLTGTALKALAQELKELDPTLIVILAIDQVLEQKYTDLLAQVGLTSSRGEAVRLVQNGGGYLNNAVVSDASKRLSVEDIIDKTYLLLGAGKKKKKLIVLK
jgi:tyrosyl-tRNA synthetase